ncbi:MAG: cytochrome P450 [Roseiflexaceae bacterium]|jgi:cytochrome P450
MGVDIPVDRGYFGYALSLTVDQFGVLCTMHRRHPQIVNMVLNRAWSMCLITHPDLVEEVLVTKQKSFTKDAFLTQHASDLFGNGLLSSDGSFWLRQRRMMQPAFHRQRIQQYSEIVVAQTHAHLAKLRIGAPIDISHVLMELTLDIVSQALFGTINILQQQQLGDALDVTMRQFASEGWGDVLTHTLNIPVVNKPWQRYLESVAVIDGIIDRIITTRQADATPHTDLLAMLLDARDEDGNPMSATQLRDECKTMFLAGHETTALTLAWSMWLVARHPVVGRTLRSEIQRVIGTRAPTFDDIPQLVYVDQVLREAMRLYPPAFLISRSSREEVTIGDYTIPAHTDVHMSQYAMHRDARFYANPDVFMPERWTDEFKAQLPKYAYFPFGGGPRLCIGQQFAMMEATLILVMLVQYADWSVLPLQRVIPQAAITMRPKYGIKMRPHHH